MAQSLAVGPVFSAAFLGALLAQLSGGLGPLVVLVTLVGMLGLGWTVSGFARRVIGVGVVYEYVGHALGRRMSIFAAVTYHLGVIAFAAGGIPLVGGMVIRDFASAHFGLALPWWAWSVVFAAFVAAVNSVGASFSVRTQLAILIVSLCPFAITAAAVIAKGGLTGNSLRGFDPSAMAQGGSIMNAVLFAILMFVGFELAAALGEEAADPKRSIPRAILGTIGIVAGIFLVSQYVLSIAAGTDGSVTVQPFFDVVAAHYVGSWLGVWIELAVLLDLIAVGVGFSLAGARGLLGLARDGVLPRGLSGRSRRGEPIMANLAILLVFGLVVVVTLLAYGTRAFLDERGQQVFLVPEEAFWGTLILARAGGLLLCGVYALLCVGALVTFARARLLDAVAALVGLAIAVLGVASSFVRATGPQGDERFGIALAAGAAVVGAGLAMTARRPAPATRGCDDRERASAP